MRPVKKEGKPNFRSKFEEQVWDAVHDQLLEMEFEPHYLPYVIKGNYLPDMRLPNGIYIEVKGYLDAASCRKMKAVKESNPHLDIRFVFYKASAPVSRLKLKHWQWAEKYGFPWAEGRIPLEWFKEKGKIEVV